VNAVFLIPEFSLEIKNGYCILVIICFLLLSGPSGTGEDGQSSADDDDDDDDDKAFEFNPKRKPKKLKPLDPGVYTICISFSYIY
jgi:hypothetical protein